MCEPSRGFCWYLPLNIELPILPTEPAQLLPSRIGQSACPVVVISLHPRDPVQDRLRGQLRLPAGTFGDRAARASSNICPRNSLRYSYFVLSISSSRLGCGVVGNGARCPFPTAAAAPMTTSLCALVGQCPPDRGSPLRRTFLAPQRPGQRSGVDEYLTVGLDKSRAAR